MGKRLGIARTGGHLVYPYPGTILQLKLIFEPDLAIAAIAACAALLA
jgi:hypothetical protein